MVEVVEGGIWALLQSYPFPRIDIGYTKGMKARLVVNCVQQAIDLVLRFLILRVNCGRFPEARANYRSIYDGTDRAVTF